MLVAFDCDDTGFGYAVFGISLAAIANAPVSHGHTHTHTHNVKYVR
jgi:hypothetical protein